MPKEINLIFSCDKYKNKSSFELIGVFTNIEERDNAINHLLKNDKAEMIEGYNFKEYQSSYNLNIQFKNLYFTIVEENEFDNGHQII
jgi:hypothetical protein